MKKHFQHFKSFFQALLILTTLSSFAQQQFIHTANRANNAGNGDATWLDIPELNNNPSAILFVTPELVDGINLNSHPIGVYYFQKKWNIFNLDQRTITENSRFNVTYFTSPDKDHFLYTIKQEDIQREGAALINHPALNSNPNAQVRFLNSWGPEIGLTVSNRDEVVMQYNADAGKWAVTNINKKPLFAGVTYNIAVSSGGNANSNTGNTNPVNNLKTTGNSTSGPIISINMTAWANGIQVPGGNNVKYPGTNEIIDFSMGANTPYDIATGRTSSAKVYELITIKTGMGFPTTIPFFNAFAKNQPMEFTFETFSVPTSGSGAALLNYTIKLTGARIVSFKQNFDSESGLNSKKYDEIKISFSQIEFIKDGVSVLGK